MAELIVPTIVGQKFSGDGEAAAKNITWGKQINVCSSRFGADPTGKVNCTQAFVKALAEANEWFLKGAGGGTVYVPPGTYLVDAGVIKLNGRQMLLGSPKNTFLVVDQKSIPAGGFSEPTPVIGVGSWLTPAGGTSGDKYMMRSGVENIVIKGVYAEDWQAASGVPKNLVGILFNTNLTASPMNPDAYHHMVNIEIWDTDFGVMIIGQDDQGMKVNNIHIDGCGSAGFIVGRPKWHPEQISTSGADNHFFNVDVHGTNKSGGNHAGIEVYTSNCVFVACKAWYTKRVTLDNTTVDSTDAPDRFWRLQQGAGFYVRGERNKFIGCESQETGNHGFVIAGSNCTLTGCTADAASFYRMAGTEDTVNATSDMVSTAAGFAITTYAQYLTMSSCQSYNLRGVGKANKWGFWIQDYVRNISVLGCGATGHLTADVSQVTKWHADKNIYLHVNKNIWTDHVTTVI